MCMLMVALFVNVVHMCLFSVFFYQELFSVNSLKIMDKVTKKSLKFQRRHSSYVCKFSGNSV
jgi:hypothetical protein